MEKAYPADSLKTTRLLLRRYELADAPGAFAAIDANRAHIGAFMAWVPSIKAVSDVENFIRTCEADWLEAKTFNYRIFTLDDNSFVGAISAHAISWHDERAEIGYWTLAASQGKGFISEALRALEAELFRLGIHRIEIRCNDTNARSAAVPKRCGYTHEATLREDVMEMGKRRNSMIWAKLRTDG